MRTRIVILGAGGRMGRALIQAMADFDALVLSAAVASATSGALGRDAGEFAGAAPRGVRVSADLGAALQGADVAIDFSTPQATAAHLAACRAAGVALLLGTTGYPEALEAQFAAAARDMPLLVAPNTSLGVTLLLELVRTAARALPGAFDIEILETHHRMKRDAPSGTALALARAAGEGRALAPEAALAAAGEGRAGPRPAGQIGFAVLRGGDVAGEHEVRFLGTGETLVLGHRAGDRSLFARGALTAALWLAQRPAGRYFMRDILFQNQ
ncbi:MAG: 4-hydroxy-tetrahydrodipicolinate reductase [Steroidobacteraceae bacterium]